MDLFGCASAHLNSFIPESDRGVRGRCGGRCGGRHLAGRVSDFYLGAAGSALPEESGACLQPELYM